MSTALRLNKALLLSVITVFFCAAVVGCNSLPESSFELASGSRLPVWFTLSPGLTRADVSVTMNYYVKSTGRTAAFILHDKKGRVLGKVTGTLRGSSPVSIHGDLPNGVNGYPSFEVVNVHGVMDVVEHKAMEPIFYITDDPVVVKALLHPPPGVE
jgi:hypothetical protein